MSVFQQLQKQEMNFSLKMEDEYLRQLGGFVDLLHFYIQSLGSLYIIEVLLPPLAVVLLFWYYFALSYLCLTDILIEIYDVITTPDRLSAQYHFFPPFILQWNSAFVIVITKLASCTLLLSAVCSTGWVFLLKLKLFPSGSSAFLSRSVIDAWQGSRAEAIQTWLLC